MATSTTGTNRKKLLLPTTMSKAGWALVEARDDIEGVSFVPTVPKAELHQLLEDIAGIIHVHPTLGEAFHESALRALGHAIHI